MNIKKITAKNKTKLDLLTRRFGIVFIVAFGSQISGKTHPESDLDIGVISQKKITGKDFLNLFASLQDIFRGFNIHLNLLNKSNIIFRHKVISEGKFIFGDRKYYSHYKNLVHKIYLTDMPKITQYHDKILNNSQKLLKESIYG